MNHYNKRFCQILADKCDGPGRDLAVRIFTQTMGAQFLGENDEAGGKPANGYWDVEFFVPALRSKLKVEVELGPDRFVHKTCHIPQRKEKTIATLVGSVCEDKAWFVRADVMKNAPVVWKWIEGLKEPFFELDWRDGWFCERNEHGWTRFKKVISPSLAFLGLI